MNSHQRNKVRTQKALLEAGRKAQDIDQQNQALVQENAHLRAQVLIAREERGDALTDRARALNRLDRQEAEIKLYLTDLQAAHEERDALKVENERLSKALAEATAQETDAKRLRRRLQEARVTILRQQQELNEAVRERNHAREGFRFVAGGRP